ncbi:hypothetical protein Tsubulata_011675 [Turnera subulata]|uniref:Protein BPS1, chloroplastic n=1 Tax=Turnera subulata TaxID=218843 RepID=A0A9Q0G4H1_9ROSI|nr:hypothetical protein Tsubulata_011675 [Turnera subulata]
MVLLIEKLNKIYSKLENHHPHPHPHPQHQSEVLLASLEAFKSDVSNFINQLRLNLKPGTGILSLTWVQQCFELLCFTNKAFAKLAVDIDYHMREWKAKTIEEYLNSSLSLLDLLNSVTSSLSHLRQARLLLSHALSVVGSSSSPASGIERLKDFKFKTLNKDFKQQEGKEADKERTSSDKEWVVYQALMEVKRIEFWVCSVLMAALSGDAKPYLEMRKSAGMLSSTSLVNLDNRVYEIIVEKGFVLREVEELKEGADGLAASAAAKGSSNTAVEEMQRRLKGFEELLDSFRKGVDRLFSEVLTGRNELLHSIRYTKH